MLEDNYRTFENISNVYIPEWKHVSKNLLFNKCIEFEESNPKLSDAYFCAIMCRYWDRLSSLYFNSQPVFSEQDCYDWLINSVIYTLKNRKWLDPKCALYGDINGPDKALNICIKSERLTAYQASNRYKRKGNAITVSLEKQLEEYGDYYTPVSLTDHISDKTSYDYIVKQAFEVKDYFKAFMVDLILYDDVFTRELDDSNNVVTSFNRKKLLHCMRMINDDYLAYFSNNYDIPLNKVQKAYTYCKDLSTDVYMGKVERVRKELYKYFKENI